jgi:hypothetical protein
MSISFKLASKDYFRDRIICVSSGKSMNSSLQFDSKIGDYFYEKKNNDILVYIISAKASSIACESSHQKKRLLMLTSP